MALNEEPTKPGQLRDGSVLWRASLWGGAAIVALAAAILMTQTDIGSQRLQMVFASEPPQNRVVTQADFLPRPDPDMQRRETARLEAQVRELAADRERLNARIATLEQNLSDVTGSIKRDTAASAARASTPADVTSATAPRSEVAGAVDGKNASHPDSPQEARLQTPEAQTPQGSRQPDEDAKMAEARAAAAKAAAALPQISVPQITPPPAAAPQIAAAPAAAPQTADAQTVATVTPPQPAAPQIAPPLGEPIRLPPMRIAAVVAGGPGGHELAVDLGGARSIQIMQARWAAVKANFGPLLDGLRPLMVRDPRPHMIPYRLIVGPLPNAAAAAQVCARFAASKVTCRTTKFAGEQLSIPQ